MAGHSRARGALARASLATPGCAHTMSVCGGHTARESGGGRCRRLGPAASCAKGAAGSVSVVNTSSAQHVDGIYIRECTNGDSSRDVPRTLPPAMGAPSVPRHMNVANIQDMSACFIRQHKRGQHSGDVGKVSLSALGPMSG